jgi:hypothetical protein
MLILLLAACEQTTHELKQADVAVDGLGDDLETLSSRLHDLLGHPSEHVVVPREHLAQLRADVRLRELRRHLLESRALPKAALLRA